MITPYIKDKGITVISENESKHETANLCLELFPGLDIDVVTSGIHIACQVPHRNKNTSNGRQISNYFKLYFIMLSHYLLDWKQTLFSFEVRDCAIIIRRGGLKN